MAAQIDDMTARELVEFILQNMQDHGTDEVALELALEDGDAYLVCTLVPKPTYELTSDTPMQVH